MTKLKEIVVPAEALKILYEKWRERAGRLDITEGTGNVNLESDALESAEEEGYDRAQNNSKTLPDEWLRLVRASALWRDTHQIDVAEVDDPENYVSEVDDPENDVSEIDDPENDVPEVDDPEVAAPVSEAVVCSLLPQNPFELRWNDDEGSVYTLETLSNGNIAYTIRDKMGDLKTLMIYDAEGTMITEMQR